MKFHIRSIKLNCHMLMLANILTLVHYVVSMRQARAVSSIQDLHMHIQMMDADVYYEPLSRAEAIDIFLAFEFS